MTKSEALSVIFGVLSAFVSFIGYYFYIRSEIYRKTEDAVSCAEATGEVGREKLKSATEQLYLTVPTFLRPFITREAVETAVQNAFDKIEEYARRQR